MSKIILPTKKSIKDLQIIRTRILIDREIPWQRKYRWFSSKNKTEFFPKKEIITENLMHFFLKLGNINLKEKFHITSSHPKKSSVEIYKKPTAYLQKM